MEGPKPGGEFKNQVLQATDIVELIGQSVVLKRRGKDFVGLCPFHSEKTPSFHVSPSKQFFHCYGCKEGGNAIDFVMKRDRIEFLPALRLLAEQAGLEMPRFGASKEKAGERQVLLEAHSAACALFEKTLADPQRGQAGREYLESRGFTADSIRRFQIGVAMDAWDGLLTSPMMRKFPPPQLALAGLVKPRERGGGFYDTFRNRLMFPIRDENGRVIAFGGRVMPGSQDPAKYLNSPETALFSKSRCVFGLDLAKPKIVETRTVAVVEGYTDVVMAHQFGAGNVVSVLGTAMTEQQVAILRRFADRIVLLFDADTAGDKAVDRAVELFLTQPIEIAIASMPEGVDPDEYLLQNGIEAFNALLAGAADALTYKWKQLNQRFQSSGGDLTGQQQAVEQYLDLLAQARGSGPVDAIRWGSALARVSRLTEIPVAELNRRFKAPKRVSPPIAAQAAGGEQPNEYSSARSSGGQPVPPRKAAKTARDRAEDQILGVLLAEPQRWTAVQQHLHPSDFTDEGRRKLAEIYWTHQRDEGEPVFSELLSLLGEPETKSLAIELVDEVLALEDTDAMLQSGLEYLRHERESAELRKLQSQIRRTSDEQEQPDLLKLLQEKARKPDLRRIGS